MRKVVFLFLCCLCIACDSGNSPSLSPTTPSTNIKVQPGSSNSQTSSASVNPLKSPNTCGNPNDWIPDDEALQKCLDRGGRIELEAGTPGYIVNGLNGDPTRGLWLTRPGTVLTSRGGRARIIAGRDLFTRILQTQPQVDINNFSVENVSFDGMVDTMMPDGLYRRRIGDCTADDHPGNLAFQGYDFQIINNESQHAMCGGSLGLIGRFTVRGNYIAHNGRDKFSGGPWSDGITILSCKDSVVTNNTLVDNTDIQLALGGGHGCIVADNTIVSAGKLAFAGLNIGNFGSGDHSGSEYRNNIISANPGMMYIGLLVGSHPWDTSVWVYNAGKVIGNTSSGSDLNLGVDGVLGGEITGNIVHDPHREVNDPCNLTAHNYTVFPPHVTGTTLQGGWEVERLDANLWCSSEKVSSQDRRRLF